MKNSIASAVILFLFVGAGAAIAEDAVVKKMKEAEKAAKQEIKTHPPVTKKLKVIEYDANTSSVKQKGAKKAAKKEIKAHPPVTKKLKVIEYKTGT